MQRLPKYMTTSAEETTWYYYSYYNCYDNERREYRYEPYTKKTEWIQQQPVKQQEDDHRDDNDDTVQFKLRKRNSRHQEQLMYNNTDRTLIDSSPRNCDENLPTNQMHDSSTYEENTGSSIILPSDIDPNITTPQPPSNNMDGRIVTTMEQRLQSTYDRIYQMLYDVRIAERATTSIWEGVESFMIGLTSPNVATLLLLSAILQLFLILSSP